MSSYISSNVLCPFYKNSIFKYQTIYCEGVQDGTSTHLSFADKGRMKEYIKSFCCNDYQKCLISQMLYQKYAM